MAYSSTNPAVQIAGNGFTASIYRYESTHAHSAVEVANFFTGCAQGSPSSNCIGMRLGDLVVVVNQSTAGSSAVTWHRVSAISTSTGWGGALHATVSAASS